MVVDGGEQEFLRSWFEVLRGRVTVYEGAAEREHSDCVRIGRDPRNDFWLRVSHHTEAATNDDEHAARRQLREAVLLTSHVATVDSTCYTQCMVDLVGLDLPSYFMRGVDKLPNKYAFVVDDDSDLLHPLLGSKEDTEYSDAFVRDLQRVQALLLEHRGISWDQVEPVPLLLQLTKQLDSMALIVHWTRQRVQQCREDTSVVGLGLGSLFDVAAVDIDLQERHHGLSWDTINSCSGDTMEVFPVFRALDCGVPVEYACVPHHRITGDDVYQEPTMVDVTQLIYDMVLGGNVRHLVVDWGYEELFPRLCSALVSARGVRTLELVPRGRSDCQIFDDSVGQRADAWRWLVFALLSSASTSSVETLVINGDELLPADVDAILELVEAAEEPSATARSQQRRLDLR